MTLPEIIFHALADQCAEQGELMQMNEDFSAVMVEGQFDLVRLADKISQLASVVIPDANDPNIERAGSVERTPDGGWVIRLNG
tara:strand:+ start:922 stop:1170 length:249 start_codon:yes stop_codon:yes gene_type:complete